MAPGKPNVNGTPLWMKFIHWLLAWFLPPAMPGFSSPVEPPQPVVTPPPSLIVEPPPSLIVEPPPIVEPPQVIGRGTLNANFLAFAPTWEMGDDRQGDCGLFYYRWDSDKRARFRDDYIAAGYTDVPICVMPGGSGMPTTKEASLDLAHELEEEIHASGMRWLHMLITDRGDRPMTYSESVAWAQYIVPRTSADFLCAGWEFPDPTRGGGFAVADGTEWGWSGDTWQVLDFLEVLRGLAPYTPLDLHFRPGWWSTAGPEDTDDHTLWREGRERELVFGLLYQPRLNDTTAEYPNSDSSAAFWAFEYPWSDTRLPGIAGRVRHYMGDGSFRYFETARHQSTWDIRMARYRQYDDTSGGQG